MTVDQHQDRRAHPRVTASFSVRVRRLGTGRRTDPSDVVQVVDLSLGGMRVKAPRWVGVGDVVQIEVDDLGVRGLVVNVSPRQGPALHAHIAFTNISGPTLAAICEIVDLHTLPRIGQAEVTTGDT